MLEKWLSAAAVNAIDFLQTTIYIQKHNLLLNRNYVCIFGTETIIKSKNFRLEFASMLPYNGISAQQRENVFANDDYHNEMSVAMCPRVILLSSFCFCFEIKIFFFFLSSNVYCVAFDFFIC